MISYGKRFYRQAVNKIWIAGLVFLFSIGVCSYSYADAPGISKESIDLLTSIGHATAEVVDAVSAYSREYIHDKNGQGTGRGKPFHE